MIVKAWTKSVLTDKANLKGTVKMRAVITVIGHDMVGIMAGVSNICAKSGVNILEISQSIMQDLFCMIMMVDISGCNQPFAQLREDLENYGSEIGLSVHVMHEDIFNSMHRI